MKPSLKSLEALAAAAALPALVYLVAADDVIRANIRELSYQPRFVAWCIIAFAAATALHFFAQQRTRILRVCAAAAMFLIVSTFLRPMLPSFNFSTLPLIAIDLLIFLTLFALTTLAQHPTLVRLMALFAVISIGHVVATHALWVSNLGPDPTLADARKFNRPGNNTAGNVYHLVLDAYQGELLPYVLDKHKDISLPGFRYYAEHNAMYPRTDVAMPALLLGRTHRPGEDIDSYRSDPVLEGFWPVLAAQNVRLSLYPYYSEYCRLPAAVCMSPDKVPANKSSALKTATLIDFWFLRVMPNSVAFLLSHRSYAFAQALIGNESRDGFSISRRVLKTVGSTETLALLSHSMSESRQLMSRTQFDQMLADEAARPASGQYVFIHVLIPHGPWTVDEQCNSIPKEQNVVNGRVVADGPIAATVCATRLAARLAARLQELGRLQNSMIVMQSDHGDPMSLSAEKDGKFNRGIDEPTAKKIGQLGLSLPQFMHYWSVSPDWPPALVDISSSSLLAIKFPGAQNFETTQIRSAVIDIAPTILAHFGVDASKYPGVALQTDPDLSARPIEFYAVTRKPFRDARFVFEDGTWIQRRKDDGSVSSIPN